MNFIKCVTWYLFTAGPIPLRVREAEVPIVNDNQCVRKINAVTEKIFILPASSFCAGGEEAHDACQVTRTMLNSEVVKISNLRDLLQKIHFSNVVRSKQRHNYFFNLWLIKSNDWQAVLWKWWCPKVHDKRLQHESQTSDQRPLLQQIFFAGFVSL